MLYEMKKYVYGFVILVTCLLCFGASAVNAQAPNNKFGIHIIDESDLSEAAGLVNSEGGEWGYVTIVIREDERDVARWQNVMDQVRRLKLIPIVRLATKMSQNYWEAPSQEEAVNWAGFLNSLNWPVKNRYVVLFNEPNHAKEWGGTIDPAGYAKIARGYLETLKKFSSEFFVLPGALDLAASNTAGTMDASAFFSGMHKEDNYIFTIFDGHNSHSYPNPGFVGSPQDTGKRSIAGYRWELEHLYNYGLSRDTAIFITETGWAKSNEEAAENYKYAFEHVWTDPNIVAITPFVLNYKGEPFDQFSWKDPISGAPRPQFSKVAALTKIKGTPEQLHSFEFKSHTIADYLVSDSEYSFYVEIKNTGQSIWSAGDGFSLSAESTMNTSNIKIADIKQTEPGQTTQVGIRLVTNEPRGIHTLKFSLLKGENKIGDVMSTKFTLTSPPSLDIFARFWPSQTDNRATLSLYEDQEFITSYENLSFRDGYATIPALTNIIPNRTYKFILSKPFFVSVVRLKTVYVGNVDINFGHLLPLDLNGDGALSVHDLISYIANPTFLLIRLYNL